MSRFGEGTLEADAAGVFVGGVELVALGGDDFDSRPQANKSKATNGSDTR